MLASESKNIALASEYKKGFNNQRLRKYFLAMNLITF